MADLPESSSAVHNRVVVNTATRLDHNNGSPGSDVQFGS
jgi:hypothetical protein